MCPMPERVGCGAVLCFQAAKLGLPKCTALFLKMAAGINVASGERKHTPLHYAAYYGHDNVARALLDAGAVTDVKNACVSWLRWRLT